MNTIPYSLPLQRPLRLGTFTLTERHGILLQATDESGQPTGWGDVAPLPGFSTESLDDVVEALKKPASSFPYPSLRFGYWAMQQPLFSTSASFPLCALLQGDQATVLNQVQVDLDQGFHTFKLKVGRYALEEDIETVLKILSLCDGQAHLRLDANRQWDYETARAFAKAVHDDSIAFIEEPLKESNRLAEWITETGFPTALDESLDLIYHQPAIQPAALIVKPTFLGGLNEIQPFIKAGQQKEIPLIFSAAYESGIGLRAIVHLASLASSSPAALGLDTYRWLKSDVLTQPLNWADGKIHLEEFSELSSIVQI